MPSPASPDHPLPSSEWSTFEWNTIIRCSPPLQALSIYANSMLLSGARPNKFTFTFLLKACLRAPAFSPLIHAHLAKLGLHADPFLRSALIAAYAAAGRLPVALRLFRLFPHPDLVLRTALVSAFARCGLPDAARQAFDEIPNPNPVSWAALLSAYTRSGRHAEALSFFRRMRLAGVAPTEAALVSALLSAAVLGALVDGERAHRDVLVFGKSLTPGLGTALLVVYAKCGRIESARRLFDEMPKRDQPAWTAMITALASHGRGEEALRLFDEMLGLGLIPDHVTYVGVLHACSHAGLVDQARGHFDNMVNVYGIEPGAEHYGCMVDVLGRAGLVEEAWAVARRMPMAPDERVLKSLLSASCALGFVECAEWAAERLVALDAGHASAYVLLSNMFAGLGRWEESARVRKLMRVRGVPKAPGCSAVD
ncbi:pentatricopeptide repeat-containing protein At3g62890-like [Phoenix dactylifera]|uniref:Pentatricopeptide repeat-containing protein At3g62890-like n=1 Tax=Phoenix dactylifera TaxID=42345 RepID=A0A8B9A8U8_PHODC|nr:pentatricopeptide repeat-containing protein At3g62890-like [Phoenix dactylifera]